MALFRQECSLRLCLLLVLTSLVNSDLICEDKSQSCKKWSRKKLCNENTKYKKQRFYVSMSRLCRKSCIMCGDDDPSLFDSDSRCNSYSEKGYCNMEAHQGFMLKRCQYSCRNTIRSGIRSRGRGNFHRNDPPAQQAQNHAGYWNQQQLDYRYPQQYGQQYAQQYSQQYGQQAQNYGQQQYPQQYAQQQSYAPTADQQQQQSQQTAGQQQLQAQQTQTQGDQSFANMPVQVQPLNPSRKHNLEKKEKHHDDEKGEDDSASDVDDDMD